MLKSASWSTGRTRITKHTSDSHHGLRLLASNKENDISLARIDIVILQEKRLVYAIFLQGRELDKEIQ
jgi:hypothetical protein